MLSGDVNNGKMFVEPGVGDGWFCALKRVVSHGRVIVRGRCKLDPSSTW
jgi:hypothetical protein